MLAAHPGGSQGRPGTTSGSQPISQYGLPYLLLPEAPKPGRRAYAGTRCFRGGVSCPDNAMNYRHSGAFAGVLAQLGARHILIRPHCPWTNGKIERLNRTLLREWAYARVFASNTERAACLPSFIEHYNTRRRHSALGGLPPVSRLSTT